MVEDFGQRTGRRAKVVAGVRKKFISTCLES